MIANIIIVTQLVLSLVVFLLYRDAVKRFYHASIDLEHAEWQLRLLREERRAALQLKGSEGE